MRDQLQCRGIAVVGTLLVTRCEKRSDGKETMGVISRPHHLSIPKPPPDSRISMPVCVECGMHTVPSPGFQYNRNATCQKLNPCVAAFVFRCVRNEGLVLRTTRRPQEQMRQTVLTGELYHSISNYHKKTHPPRPQCFDVRKIRSIKQIPTTVKKIPAYRCKGTIQTQTVPT